MVRNENLDNALSAFAASFNSIDYSPKTKKFYFEQARRAVFFLPKDVTIFTASQADVKKAVAEMMLYGLAVSTVKNYLHALIRFLAFVGNCDAASVKISFQTDTRPNVDWLTPEQAKALLNTPMSPAQAVIVILALCMGLRRIEILRLKMSDVDTLHGFVTIPGKGRAGSKLRRVSFHPRFNAALGDWLKIRHSMICCNRTAPEELLIWARSGRCYPYSDAKGTGLDGQLKKVAATVNLNFSFQTLRRTYRMSKAMQTF